MTYPPGPEDPHRRVTVTDINIPFGRLVVIILKFILASIPAMLVIYAIMAVFMLIILGLFGGAAAVLDSALKEKKVDFLPRLPVEQR